MDRYMHGYDVERPLCTEWAARNTAALEAPNWADVPRLVLEPHGRRVQGHNHPPLRYFGS
jgi:hypothetical protein